MTIKTKNTIHGDKQKLSTEAAILSELFDTLESFHYWQKINAKYENISDAGQGYIITIAGRDRRNFDR